MVVTAIDKANRNIAYICQRFYAFVLRSLVSIKKTIGINKYYIQENNISSQVISVHITFLKNKVILKVSEEDKIVPNICLSPYLHKHPSNTRFMIGTS